MSMQNMKLADIQTIEDAAASIYANPDGAKTYIRGILLHNTNSTTETVKIWNVPDAAGALGTAADGNRFVKVDLVADETLSMEMGGAFPIILTDENDSIQAESTTADVVTIQILGDIDV